VAVPAQPATARHQTRGALLESHAVKKRKRKNPNMKTTKSNIERMVRFTGYMVKLSCGHSFECSEEDLDRHHLFVGKSVHCEKCQDCENAGTDDSGDS
jgi:hypothetical protein